MAFETEEAQWFMRMRQKVIELANQIDNDPFRGQLLTEDDNAVNFICDELRESPIQRSNDHPAQA